MAAGVRESLGTGKATPPPASGAGFTPHPGTRIVAGERALRWSDGQYGGRLTSARALAWARTLRRTPEVSEMGRLHCLIIVKVVFALLGFSALITEIAVLVDRGRFAPANFFSYFTVESNALAVISLLVSAFAVATGARLPGLDFFRGAVTLYMTTTIIIFIVLLSGYTSQELTAVPWDNTVLHYIMPIALIVDWLVASRVQAMAIKRSLTWLIFPLAYLIYSLIRGPIAHWYPYPFMDPNEHGYLGVAVTSVVVAVAIGAIAALIAFVPRRTSALVLDRR